MNDNTAIFLIMAVSITAAVILFAIAAWSRTRQSSAARIADSSESARAMTLLQGENDALKQHAELLEDRVAVLERIATDPAHITAREIETLR